MKQRKAKGKIKDTGKEANKKVVIPSEGVVDDRNTRDGQLIHFDRD
jgi:hypothetical protein